MQQGRAPRFFGHAGESAGVPGAGGGVFGGDAISIVRNRGRRPVAEGGSCWLFLFAVFLCFFVKCDRVILSYYRQEAGVDRVQGDGCVQRQHLQGEPVLPYQLSARK